MPTHAWHEAVIQAFKDNNVRLVVYVPDNVLRPLIDAVHADDFFTAFVATREEEAVGIICGAAMAGLRGIVLMQTSGFATLANALASLATLFAGSSSFLAGERWVGSGLIACGPFMIPVQGSGMTKSLNGV